MTVEFRIVGRDDAALFRRVATNLFDFDIVPESVEAFLADDRHLMAAAIAEGVIIGFASGVECFHPDKPPHLFINELSIAEAHRRRGIGRRLVEMLVDTARERGCKSAWVGADADNIAANLLYSAIEGGAAAQPFMLYEWALEGRAEAGVQGARATTGFARKGAQK